MTGISVVIFAAAAAADVADFVVASVIVIFFLPTVPAVTAIPLPKKHTFILFTMPFV